MLKYFFWIKLSLQHVLAVISIWAELSFILSLSDNIRLGQQHPSILVQRVRGDFHKDQLLTYPSASFVNVAHRELLEVSGFRQHRDLEIYAVVMFRLGKQYMKTRSDSPECTGPVIEVEKSDEDCTYTRNCGICLTRLNSWRYHISILDWYRILLPCRQCQQCKKGGVCQGGYCNELAFNIEYSIVNTKGRGKN